LELEDRITIRAAKQQHIPNMLRLERLSPQAAHWSEAQYAYLIQGTEGDNTRLALIAERDFRCEGAPMLIGFLIARHLGPEWELENIVVVPEERGRGIGLRLMEELLARAKQTNGETVFLEVRESNVAAISLYRRLGFQQTGRRKSYYSDPIEDALLYSKNLGPAPISS
jgi:[ribosomal protein S18]-alanine N-acetyltransferase